MGGYLSRPRAGRRSPALGGADPPERPERLGPAHPARHVPPACRVHSAAPTLDLARRLSYQDLVASPRRRRRRRRRHRRWFLVVHRRQYPIQQPRCLFLGVFSSVPLSGHQKPLLSACSSKTFCTKVMLKMVSAKGKLMLRLALKQSVVCMWSYLSVHLPNLCVKEILVRALEESGQLRAKEEKDLTALADSKKGLEKQKKEHSAPESQDEQRGSNPDEKPQSAFRRLMVNGVFSSFVPRPGPLKRDFSSKSSEDTLVRKSQTSFSSSCSKRNAITSSYSSTRGFPELQRSDLGAAGLQGPGSSQPRVLSKKASEEGHQSSPSASVESQKIKNEKAADGPLGQKQILNCSQPSDSTRPRKRKIPLLLPSRRNGPPILPSPPQLGYPVTAEDLDLEKRAAIQWINKVLEG
ncbi:nuclear envelope pore membrane protein POM 121-like [Hippopotamus amphibius kiboko]|uniref:nuclear envelope pore membrane protein POM 121-like n=1 Tax=Hippopotamus amphibius kiboko TaxID=575201 RepID=UPI0025982ABA|nr:nuclear envelope pore membrane protein POM 121-like [Hippopotamus amphibius kiboko]